MKKIAIILMLALTITSCADKEKIENKIDEKITKVEDTQKTEIKGVDTETEIKVEVKKDIVSKGDTVTVTYTWSTTDGVIFDASSKHPGQPLSFTAGAGQMIPGFDAGVIGMKLWEAKTLNIPAEEAYGASNIIELDEVDLKSIETQWWLKKEDIKVWDNKMPLTWGILKIEKIENWKFFAKHPNALAWKDLIFEVKVESIK